MLRRLLDLWPVVDGPSWFGIPVDGSPANAGRIVRLAVALYIGMAVLLVATKEGAGAKLVNLGLWLAIGHYVLVKPALTIRSLSTGDARG